MRRISSRTVLIRISGTALLLVVVLSWFTVHSLQAPPESLMPPAPRDARPVYVDRHLAPLSATYQNALNFNDIVPLHRIPERLQESFVYSEDRRYYSHSGIDWSARASALYQNLRHVRTVRGASTITEQVVRIINPRERTLWSRWMEGWEARQLERRFSKQEILEFYLNQVPFGARRRGVVQAARYYFNRDLSTLNLKEMLALAVLVRAPSRLDPFRSQNLLNSRINSLCSALVLHKSVPASECDALRHFPLALEHALDPVDAGHFIRFISTRAETPEKNFSARVRTSLDAVLQQRIQSLLAHHLAAHRAHSLHDGAALVLDHSSGEILAWVNADRADSEVPGSHIDMVLTPRQPGSTLKPFLYALALEQGWTPATLIEDAPLQQAVGQGRHSYRNYSRMFYGPVRLRDALGNSLNTPAIRTASFIGVPELLAFLRTVGFQSLDQGPHFYGEGLALGNGEVSLLELVQAYALFAREGKQLVSPEVFPARLGAGGAPQIISTETSDLILDILSDPNARRLEFGRGGILGVSHQMALKTGTSSDFRDLWAVGITDRFVVGVWMGNLDRQAAVEVTSASGPGVVLKAILRELERIHEPRRMQYSGNLERVAVCSVSGARPHTGCPVVEELFDADNPPDRECDLSHQHHDSHPRNPEHRAPRISFPTPGLQIAFDPRIPDELEAISLKLEHGGQYHAVEWLLDGAPVMLPRTEDNSVVWRLTPGAHSLLAKTSKRVGEEFQTTDTVRFYVR